MTEFRVVSVEDLKPVLDVLNGLSWPIKFEEFPAIFERLGWEKQRRSGGKTSLPVSSQIASVGRLDDEISEFIFRISDTLSEVGPTSSVAMDEAFRRLTEVVSECMGFAPTSTPWVEPGAVWDLADGRQVRVIMGEKTVELAYWSTVLADSERYERQHEVDPFNDLADRESGDFNPAVPEAEQTFEAGSPEGTGTPQPMEFDDFYVSKEHRFSLGQEFMSATRFLSFPVTNGLVDYEEYYALSADEFAKFMDDPAQALPLLEQCRQHHQDHRLIQQPGSNRGTPV